MNQVPWAVERNSANVRRVRLVAERGMIRVEAAARRPGRAMARENLSRAQVDSVASLQAADMRVVEVDVILEVARRNVQVMGSRLVARANFLMAQAVARANVRAAFPIAMNVAVDSVARRATSPASVVQAQIAARAMTVLAAVVFAGLRVASRLTVGLTRIAAQVAPTAVVAVDPIVSGMIIGAIEKARTSIGPEFSDRQPSRVCRRASRSPADLARARRVRRFVPVGRAARLVPAVKAVLLTVPLAQAGPTVPVVRADRFVAVAKAGLLPNGVVIRRVPVAVRRENLAAVNLRSERNRRAARSRNSSSGTGVSPVCCSIRF